MEFTIEKELLSTNLKIVEKTTVARGIQPVLSNILIEASEDNFIKFSATDLDINIVSKTVASVKESGKITLPAKKLSEIASKISNKPVTFVLDAATNVVKISCGIAKFELIGISADEFPAITTEEEIKDKECTEIELNPLLKSIKHTAFSAANYENRNIISGVCCQISLYNLRGKKSTFFSFDRHIFSSALFHANAIIMIRGTVITLNNVVINTDRPAAAVLVPYCSVIMDWAEETGNAAVRISTFFNVSSRSIGSSRRNPIISNGNISSLVSVRNSIFQS